MMEWLDPIQYDHAMLVMYLEELEFRVKRQIDSKEYGSKKEYNQLVGQLNILREILERVNG